MSATRLADRLSLIVVADPEATGGRDLAEIVRRALAGGAPAVQLRAKTLGAGATVELARALAPHVREAGALFFINDRVDIALAVGADGAHLGDDDLPLPAARRIVPPGFLLGRSVDTAEEARAATAEGADYLGVGPVARTASKSDVGEPIGTAGVARVAGATHVPVVGIGGIERENAAAVAAAGAAGVAVIRAVIASDEPERAVRELLQRVRDGRRRATA